MNKIEFTTVTSTYELSEDEGVFTLKKLKLHDGMVSWAEEGYTTSQTNKPWMLDEPRNQLIMNDMHTSPINESYQVRVWLNEA